MPDDKEKTMALKKKGAVILRHSEAEQPTAWDEKIKTKKTNLGKTPKYPT